MADRQRPGRHGFSEPTTTAVISLHGAAILSRHKLSPEQELILRCPDRISEAVVRIVGQIGSFLGSYAYGLAFVDSRLNSWTLEFPSLGANWRRPDFETGYQSLQDV